jgi:hypothetical protein
MGASGIGPELVSRFLSPEVKGDITEKHMVDAGLQVHSTRKLLRSLRNSRLPNMSGAGAETFHLLVKTDSANTPNPECDSFSGRLVTRGNQTGGSTPRGRGVIS